LNCSTQQLLNNPNRRASLPRATPAQSIGWFDDAGHGNFTTCAGATTAINYAIRNTTRRYKESMGRH
jgi:hypothetical protein